MLVLLLVFFPSHELHTLLERQNTMLKIYLLVYLDYMMFINPETRSFLIVYYTFFLYCTTNTYTVYKYYTVLQVFSYTVLQVNLKCISLPLCPSLLARISPTAIGWTRVKSGVEGWPGVHAGAQSGWRAST